MKYDLFLSDFDGTLLRTDGTLSELTKQTISDYRKKGGIFAVVTGRGLLSILPRVKELGMEEGLVVASQGAVIAEVKTGKLLKKVCLSLDGAIEILRFFEQRDLHIHYYTITEFIANRKDEMLSGYETIYGRTAYVSKEPLSEKARKEKPEILKVLVMIEPEKRDALFQEAERALGEYFFVTCSSPWLVEVLPKGQSKAQAVEFLSDYYRIPRCKIAAIGDQFNDMPMLEAAGGKFAVENAEEILKKGSVVVPANDGDGVAYALRKYAMGDEI